MAEVYEKDWRYCTSSSKEGHAKSKNFVRKTPVQLMQPAKRSPTCSRQLLSRIPLGKNLHKVKKEKLPHVKSTGQRTTPSNHPLIIHIIFQTADNQMEQNLFYVNKETSQHIHLSAGPSTNTASHDWFSVEGWFFSSGNNAIDSSLAANNSDVDNSGIQAIMPIYLSAWSWTQKHHRVPLFDLNPKMMLTFQSKGTSCSD